LHAMTAVARPRQEEEMAAAAAQAPATRNPHQGRGQARAESRGAKGHEAVETPAGGDFAPRGRSRGVVRSDPEPAPGVLVVRSDGCVMSQQPAPDAAVLAPYVVPPRWEQGLHRPGVPQGLLREARAERALWQEFRTHNASLNATLTEALRLHGGRSLQIFQVRTPV
jgi:hypothetical protein